MSAKRYVPSLLIIPEEESIRSVEPSCDFSRPSSRRGSCISLKRENSRRKSCCPECEVHPRSKLPPENGLPALVACHNCKYSNSLLTCNLTLIILRLRQLRKQATQHSKMVGRYPNASVCNGSRKQ